MPYRIPAPPSCPACGVLTKRKSLFGIERFECTQCQGVWVVTENLDLLCAHLRQVVRPTTSQEPRACPECGITLAPHEVSQLHPDPATGVRARVIVDVCREHGIWFDKDELSRAVLWATETATGGLGPQVDGLNEFSGMLRLKHWNDVDW